METTVRPTTNTVRLLDAWKAKKGIDSDYKAAKALGITTPTTTNWRNGKNHAATRLAAKLAKDLGLDPGGIAAVIEADRTINPTEKKLWEDVAVRLVGRDGFEPSTSGLKGLRKAARHRICIRGKKTRR